MRVLKYVLVAMMLATLIASAVCAQEPTPVPVNRVVGKLVELNLARGIIGVLPVAPNPTDVAPTVRRFQITDMTRIVKLIPVRLPALMIGDRVEVAFVKPADALMPKAVGVHVLPETIRGVIDGVDLENRAVSIRTSPTGPSILFKVVRETKIVKNGQPATLKDLVLDDLAKINFFRFKDGRVAGLIAAVTPKSQ